MNDPPARSLPRPGDLLIAREEQSPARYAVSVVPGPAQFHCETKQQAVQQAQRFAQGKDLQLWQTDDGRTFTQIA